MQDIIDSKKFSKTIRPYFSDKGYNQTKITIVDKDSIITDEKKDRNFNEILCYKHHKKLDLRPSVSNTSAIAEITKHFDRHISECKIKEAYSETLKKDYFNFEIVSMDKVKKVVLKLNSKKLSTYGAIPVSILKQSTEVRLKYLTKTINHFLKESTFPD